jgi:hypothetical protein
MSMSSPERLLERRELTMPHDWEERVARETQIQARIEAAFDRADACGLTGQYALALEWLDLACELSGGLSRAYRQRRAHFGRLLERGSH